jgi:hypothetical protein
MTSVQLLPWPQRIGYVLTMLLIGKGWLICLALLLEWPSAYWSRPALALQAAALVLALLLRQRVPARRLVVYPLLLAASIYLWDTTLPPPNLPDGWPRVTIPGLVLAGLVGDYARTTRRVWQARDYGALSHRRIALEDAAFLLGISVAELRLRIQRRGCVVLIDAAGHEHVLLDDVYALSRPKPASWWQLYLWALLMLGLGGLATLAGIPPSWQTTVRIAWCLLTWGGMVVWLWANRAALRDEERAKRRAGKPYRPAAQPETARTIPLTPVQRRFLEVMERHERR